MTEKILELITETSIFKGANEELLAKVLGDDTAPTLFPVGATVQKSGTERNLSVILSGKAEVLSTDMDRQVLIRTLDAGDVFGVAELFCGGNTDRVSRIVTVKQTEILFIPESKMSILLERDKRIMYNYLNFLSCRIRFLNKRIACFTAGSAERRLALYLDSLAEYCECENKPQPVTVTPEMSMGALALMLDIGRASLYRAVDTLVSDGFIKKDGKSFILYERERMLKNYNKQEF